MPSPLTVQEALRTALAAECKARPSRRAVLDAFGLILPFATVIRSEQRRMDTLLALLGNRFPPTRTDLYAAGLSAPAT